MAEDAKDREREKERVVCKALLRSAAYLKLPRSQLGRILGISPSTISRLGAGCRLRGKAREVALLLVRLVRSLDQVVGGSADDARAWFYAENFALSGKPVQLICCVEGLVLVVTYVERIRHGRRFAEEKRKGATGRRGKVTYCTIALDLEGTLISNAVSIFPRPGLYQFLFFCLENFERVVIYTSVPEPIARKIMEILCSEGSAPEAFSQLEVFTCDRHMQKDLVKLGPLGEVLLVDDQESYVVDIQRQFWIPVQEFMPPFVQADSELQRVKEKIIGKLSECRGMVGEDEAGAR